VEVAPSRFLEGLPEAQVQTVEDAQEAPLDGKELAAMTRELLERL
jgi:hypothetical protein